jgi:phage terminase large subunit-like protein
MVNDAITYGGSTAVDVMTLNFNMWVDSPSVFIPQEVWNLNAHGISEDELLGRECYGGIEIVSGKMLNAFALLFPDVEGKTAIKTIFWMPSSFKREHERYDEWVKSGLIHEDVGNVADDDWAFDIIASELSKYRFNSFSFKNSLENYGLVQKMIKNGFTGNPISHGRQGISTPTLVWEEMITKGEMEHFKNPVLEHMNSNCTAVRKENEIRLEKSGSRVVGIYACLNAVAQWKTVESEAQNDQIIEFW